MPEGRPGEPAAKLRHAAQSLSGRLPEQGIQRQGVADAERAFDAMRDIIRKWDEDGVLLRRAQTVMPFVELARELSGQVPDFLKREGAVPARLRPRLARQVLSGDYGVPKAFCRLGTSLTHILVDEFQDTSREQWEAIHPLVLEALSRGGSLTWVGDVKQAIYGWRGGDATLFDEVRSDAELCAVAPEPRVDILPTTGGAAGHRRNQQHPVPPAFRNSHG